MFNAEQKIQRYETIADIIEEFYEQRIRAYGRRKQYLLTKFQREYQIIESKISFINAVMMGKYKMMNTKESWVRQLAIDKYKRYNELVKV